MNNTWYKEQLPTIGQKEKPSWYQEQMKASMRAVMNYRRKMAEDIEGLLEEFNLSPYDTISSLTSMLRDSECMTNSQKGIK